MIKISVCFALVILCFFCALSNAQFNFVQETLYFGPSCDSSSPIVAWAYLLLDTCVNDTDSDSSGLASQSQTNSSLLQFVNYSGLRCGPSNIINYNGLSCGAANVNNTDIYVLDYCNTTGGIISIYPTISSSIAFPPELSGLTAVTAQYPSCDQKGFPVGLTLNNPICISITGVGFITTCNDTHIFNQFYDNEDCSGTPLEYSDVIPIGCVNGTDYSCVNVNGTTTSTPTTGVPSSSGASTSGGGGGTVGNATSTTTSSSLTSSSSAGTTTSDATPTSTPASILILAIACIVLLAVF